MQNCPSPPSSAAVACQTDDNKGEVRVSSNHHPAVRHVARVGRPTTCSGYPGSAVFVGLSGRPAYRSPMVRTDAGPVADPAVRSLRDLPAVLARDESFAAVVAALSQGSSASIDGAWASAQPLAIATLATEHTGPLIAVVSRPSDVDDLAADLEAFSGFTADVFPAWETLPKASDEHALSDTVFGRRIRTLKRLETGQARVIVAPVAALMQPVPSRAARAEASRTFAVGDDLDLTAFSEWLVAHNFARTTAIREPGEFSIHGGILDVFPIDSPDPIRMELFGDEIESIRFFDVESQRKISDVDSAEMLVVTPALLDETTSDANANGKKAKGDTATPAMTHFAESIPSSAWVTLPELNELHAEGRDYLHRMDDPRGLYSVAATMEKLCRVPTCVIAGLAGSTSEQVCHLRVESVEKFTGPKTEIADELDATIGRDETLLLACHNEGEHQRLSELFGLTPSQDDAAAVDDPPAIAGRLRLCLGGVTRGFRWVNEHLVVIGDHELWGRPDVRRATKRKSKRAESRAIDSFLDLKPGDLVVHIGHGIGKFLGMELLPDEQGNREEHLKLEFRDGVQIFVPTSLIHLVQKYVGATKKGSKGVGVKLSKLGGTAWSKQKDKVASAVNDMAADMLRMQAARESQPGRACSPDNELVREFAAAFPYVETPDQVSAIEDCGEDLVKTRPMDRLICGDVGFGKTEVAMRAAFKMAAEGRQVAVLVPTTVLCEQHERSFKARMAEFPITVESVSRFKTKSEQQRTLERLKSGALDIIIGTHRLVSKDVHFKNLGLLIIDEEQRFGVDMKERLKRLRLDVDVLTLSATPIPRTLHMSLLGIRDISNLTTPPADRVPIETRVVRFDADLIRSAIVRELNRGGQCYFVHNRVYNIQEVADRIQSIVPEARITIGHGQMSERQLEKAMVDFVSKKVDILVATTIIESGLDIPTANTMFINQANNYGLADLHQLRGRVGRYKHRAYCYLVLDEKKVLSGTSAKRLKAIEEFSDLGAGFQIAMRDLEIRGAGNILGGEQSGHITQIGYELYCQLLENSVRRLKKLPPRDFPHATVDLPIEAFLPGDYVPNGRTKIDVYRRLAATESVADVAEVRDELRDRFGPIPDVAENLIRIRELQLHAWSWGIDDVRLEDGYARFRYRDAQRINSLGGRFGREFRIVDTESAYLVLPRDITGRPLIDHLINAIAADKLVAA